MPTARLTHEIINAAIEGYESQKAGLDGKIAELRAMLNGGHAAPTASPEAPATKRRKFSAAARRRMKEAQQRRWAKIKGESELPVPAVAPKKKRRISKEGMARIIAATKKRWALKRAEADKAQSPVAEKTPRKKVAA